MERDRSSALLTPAVRDGGQTPILLEVRYDSGLPVLCVHGELDIGSAPLLDAGLAAVEACEERLAVDLHEVSFADVRGLEPIVRRRRDRPDRLQVRRPSRAVRLVMELLMGADRGPGALEQTIARGGHGQRSERGA